MLFPGPIFPEISTSLWLHVQCWWNHFHQILPSGKQTDGHLSFGHSVFGAWTPSHPWKTEAGVIAAGGDALTSQLPWARLPDYLTDMQNVRLLLHISVLPQEGGLKGRKSEQQEVMRNTERIQWKLLPWRLSFVPLIANLPYFLACLSTSS